MQNRFGTILLCILITTQSLSQKPVWNARLFPFFDNTEFSHSQFRIPQTMSGVRFAPEAGLEWDSIHRIIIGVNILHEFGSNKSIGDFYPTAYYQYNRRPFRFIMGAFPREYALEKYPRIFFQDSISYYRPNVNGILWEYTRDRIHLSVWLDWTGRQSIDTRETFFWGITARYKAGIFYAQHFSYMFHFSGPLHPVVNEALHDNGMVLNSAGIDLSGRTFFDRLEINGGWIAGPERARADNTGWIVHNGFLSEAWLEYKRVGLYNTLYLGDSQMSFYSDHRNELYWGDPFYRATKYNRSDFYIDFIKNRFVNTRLIYSLHFTGGRIYHEQTLKVYVNLNNPDHKQ